MFSNADARYEFTAAMGKVRFKCHDEIKATLVAPFRRRYALTRLRGAGVRPHRGVAILVKAPFVGGGPSRLSISFRANYLPTSRRASTCGA